MFVKPKSNLLFSFIKKAEIDSFDWTVDVKKDFQIVSAEKEQEMKNGNTCMLRHFMAIHFKTY